MCLLLVLGLNQNMVRTLHAQRLAGCFPRCSAVLHHQNSSFCSAKCFHLSLALCVSFCYLVDSCKWPVYSSMKPCLRTCPKPPCPRTFTPSHEASFAHDARSSYANAAFIFSSVRMTFVINAGEGKNALRSWMEASWQPGVSPWAIVEGG